MRGTVHFPCTVLGGGMVNDDGFRVATGSYGSEEITGNKMVRVDEVRSMSDDVVKVRMILPGSSKSIYRARRSVKRV